jgi:hypothetical protein
MKCVLSLDEPGQELTMNVPDVIQLINYPVSANYSGRFLYVHKVSTGRDKRPGISTPSLVSL